MSHAPTPSPRAGQTAPGAAGQTAVDPDDPNYISSDSEGAGAGEEGGDGDWDWDRDPSWHPWAATAASSPARVVDLLQDLQGALRTSSRAHGGDGAGETAPAPRDAGQQTARGDDGAGGSLPPQASPKEWSCKLVDLLPPTGRLQYLFGPGTVGHVEVTMPQSILEHKMHSIFVQIVAQNALNQLLAFGGKEPQRSLHEALRECRTHRLVEDDAYYVLKGLNIEANAAKHGEKRSRQPADSPRRRPRWR